VSSFTAKLEENAEQADFSPFALRRNLKPFSVLSLALCKTKAFLPKLSTKLKRKIQL
jgi:hypothetical protein